MMSEEYSKLKEEAQHLETWNHWRSGPARGRELKEEVMENSKKQLRSNNGIGGAPTNYRRRRRRADQKKSAAAATKCRRRRGAAGARLYQNVRFRNKDLLLQIKYTFCCLRSPLWNWWVDALSGCQIRFILSCFRLISLFRNACFANFTICF